MLEMEQELPSVIDLNVGGSKFTTRLTTLRKYPESMLAAMFSGRHKIDRDKDGNIFIDRDGEYFYDILRFLRDEQFLPAEARCENVLKEAEYFGLVELEERLKNLPPLFPLYYILEKNRAAVDDYFTIKEKIKKYATLDVLIKTGKTTDTYRTTCSSVGSATTTVYLATYSPYDPEYATKATKTFGHHYNMLPLGYHYNNMPAPRVHRASSLEEGIHALDGNTCGNEIVCVEDKTITDFEGYINTLAYDLQQERFNVSLKFYIECKPPGRGDIIALSDMQYEIKNIVQFVFKWDLIPKSCA